MLLLVVIRLFAFDTILSQNLPDTNIFIKNVSLPNNSFCIVQDSIILLDETDFFKIESCQNQFFNALNNHLANHNVEWDSILLEILVKYRGRYMNIESISRQLEPDEIKSLHGLFRGRVEVVTAILLESGMCYVFDKVNKEYIQSIKIESHIENNEVYWFYYTSDKVILRHYQGSF